MRGVRRKGRGVSTVTAYKVLTHDLRSPMQGGEPIFDGRLPFRLPVVDVDTSAEKCGAGWNACPTPEAALRIVGLWPNGWPSRLFQVVDPAQPVIEHGDKLRAASWTVAREIEITDEILARLHEPLASDGLPLADLVAEVRAWREALARPERDPAHVETGLRKALDTRTLKWSLRQYPNAQAAWDAWDAWAARDARNARDAWDAWAAWAARNALGAWDAWDVWAARATWGAWDAWDAWAARDALLLYVASRRNRIAHRPDLLTSGLCDAYRAGLELAVPVSDGVLGWVMAA